MPLFMLGQRKIPVDRLRTAGLAEPEPDPAPVEIEKPKKRGRDQGASAARKGSVSLQAKLRAKRAKRAERLERRLSLARLGSWLVVYGARAAIAVAAGLALTHWGSDGEFTIDSVIEQLEDVSKHLI